MIRWNELTTLLGRAASSRAPRKRAWQPGLFAASIEHFETRCVPAVYDLAAGMIAGPDVAEPSDKISIQTAVTNSGSDKTPKYQIEYRLSLDEVADDQDLLIATVTRPKVKANGQADWQQKVKLPADLPAGTYHLTVTVDPANRLGETSESNNTSVSSQTIVVGRSNLEGRAEFLNRSRPVEIRQLGAASTIINPSLTTWVVIHGRNQSADSANVAQLATQLDAYQASDQVLLLDWGRAAESGTIGGQGEDYIQPVAAWAAEALTAYGFTGEQLNLVGYSWGANVAAEMAEIIGQVNSVLAIDPARDYPGGSYNPEAPGEVDFDSHADQSWAFFANNNIQFGSSLEASTAADAYVVTGSDHFGVVSVVTSLIALPSENPVAARFTLSRLLTGQPATNWVADAYTDTGALDTETGTFDAVIIATVNGQGVQSLRYFDGAMEQTVLF